MKEIPLTRDMVTLVDDGDYEALSRYKWQATPAGKTYYAVRTRRIGEDDGPQTIYMHGVITGLKGPDHIDNNGLNNQRYNLRPATWSQQQYNKGLQNNNSSGFKGVTWSKCAKKWQAQIKKEGKNNFLGLYNTRESAYIAYCKAAQEHHGEHANSGHGPIDPIAGV